MSNTQLMTLVVILVTPGAVDGDVDDSIQQPGRAVISQPSCHIFWKSGLPP